MEQKSSFRSEFVVEVTTHKRLSDPPSHVFVCCFLCISISLRNVTVIFFFHSPDAFGPRKINGCWKRWQRLHFIGRRRRRRHSVHSFPIIRKSSLNSQWTVHNGTPHHRFTISYLRARPVYRCIDSFCPRTRRGEWAGTLLSNGLCRFRAFFRPIPSIESPPQPRERIRVSQISSYDLLLMILSALRGCRDNTAARDRSILDC